MWQVRGKANKESMVNKKKQIQDEFRSRLGLLIDLPVKHTGNTNDGNTTKKLFQRAEELS